MVITAIQAILIAFAVGIIVGGVVGWKLTFNMRLAKIQEQQVVVHKLKDKVAQLKGELRTLKLLKTKEKVNSAMSGVGKSAVDVTVAAGGAVSSAASSIKSKLFGKKKEEKTDETKQIGPDSSGE